MKCITSARIDTFGPVVASDATQRNCWLDRARTSGSRLSHGALSPAQCRVQRLFAWLAALRLQFYPMTWIAYTVGALAAGASKPMFMTPYLLGYLTLFLLEAATVFLNEWFDVDSDRRNQNAGLFTGGSRVLVDGRLDRAAMRKGIGLSLLAAVAALKLSHRGFGELDVALTHSAGAIMAGYVAQGGGWNDDMPWLLALPLGLSILPSILLAGCPDRAADQAAAKRTLVVILGKRRTERIDGAIVLALTFILWFCVPPLIALMGGPGA